jgi:hypothetical protein
MAGSVLGVLGLGCREKPPENAGSQLCTESAGDDQQAASLFEKCQKGPDRSLESRMEAAAKLARTRKGEKWIILIMLDTTSLDDFREAVLPQSAPAMYGPFDAAVIASILRNLPGEASGALLWSVTCRLSDSDRGAYSVDAGTWPLGRWEDRMTEPIRDLARDYLVRVIGKDCGYSQALWRQEIIERESKGN